MIQINFKKQFFTIIFLLSLCTVYGQSERVFDKNNLITLKFSSYSVDADKLIQKEFLKQDGFKSIYACIPAGIVIIVSEKTVTVTEKGLVSSKINSLNASLNYEFLEGMALSDAEKNCAIKRNIEK
jgi:hypothetical protein